MLYDIIVIGSGISGLYAALYAKKAGHSVAVLTKSNPFRSNSAVASGGINAVIDLSAYDSVEKHIDDTISGADGLSHKKNIKNMCHEAADIVKELYEMGVQFDTDGDGKFEQRPFGGASANRTCYIADRTGASIVQTLLQECRKEGIEILPNHKFLNILQYENKLTGISVLRRSNSQVIALACKSLVLAGGGYAGIFRGHSTNSQESSGDVIAAALRAKMRLSNMEFVQFHPTTLAGSGALVSEAARAEGAYLVDETQTRFTNELQTRDKLARDIVDHIGKGHKVFLDFRHLSQETIEKKLPSVRKQALSVGINIFEELLEIAPSAHYSIGGIWTRGDTSTSLPFVYACGECAVTGVHGANRLGGNSLLEGAYFGRLAGMQASSSASKRDFQMIDYAQVNKEMRYVDVILNGESRFNINSMRKNLGEVLFKSAGIYRSEKSLVDALEYIHYLFDHTYGLHCVNKELENNVELSAILEFRNALLVAEAMVLSALKREESRGVHYREDFLEKDEEKFNSNSYIVQLQDNYMEITFESDISHNLWYSLKKYLSF